MAIHDSADSVSNSSTETHTDARQAAYVAFLHRVPFALDALNMGFLPGFREGCTYQQSQFDTLECPVGMLDNDVRNPDLDRYIDRALEYEPGVGIIGDAYDAAEAQTYVDTIQELEKRLPKTEFIIVPKRRTAIEAIPDDIVLGYYHLLGDAGASIAVIISMAIIMFTDFLLVDPLTAVLIAALIVWSAIILLRESGAIFFQQSPIDIDEVRRSVEFLDRVQSVEDIHVWAL